MSTELRLKSTHIHDQSEWWWPEIDTQAWKLIEQETYLPQQVLKHVSNFTGCIHVGAHAGFFTKQYAKRFHKVYAIEPHPVNFHCLVNNINEENVIKLQVCFSDHSHLACLWSDNFANSGGYRVTPGNDFLCITMDSLNTDIGLIHVDVEGYEYFVLKGGQKILETYKPVVCIDTSSDYDSQQAIDLLLDYGYDITQILPRYTIFKKHEH